jgi:tyrosinase
MWQDLYPGKYVKPFKLGPRGPVLDANTGLLPFHKDENSNLWNSDACRYPYKSCGYTYPELQRWLDTYKTNGKFDEVKYQKALRATIDSKYSTTAKATLQLSSNDQVASTVLSTLTTQSFMVQNVPPTLLAKAPAAATEHPELKREQSEASGPSNTGKAAILSQVDIESVASPAVTSSRTVEPPTTIPRPSDEKWEENDYIVNVLYDR